MKEYVGGAWYVLKRSSVNTGVVKEYLIGNVVKTESITTNEVSNVYVYTGLSFGLYRADINTGEIPELGVKLDLDNPISLSDVEFQIFCRNPRNFVKVPESIQNI
jgi:hypothetical protein